MTTCVKHISTSVKVFLHSQPSAVCIQKTVVYHLMPDQYIFVETFISIALLEVSSS